MRTMSIEALRGEGGRGSGPAAPAVEGEDATEDVERILRCAACDAPIARERDVLPMTGEGAVAVFVNPAGFFHDIVTVRVATGLLLVGPAVAEDSWFVGYTWTIAHCAPCGAHLGWQFDAADDVSPPVFWGLRRISLSGP